MSKGLLKSGGVWMEEEWWAHKIVHQPNEERATRAGVRVGTCGVTEVWMDRYRITGMVRMLKRVLALMKSVP